MSDVHPLTQGFLGLELFMVIATPVRSPQITDELLKAHLEHQVRLEKQGILFGAGPLYPEGSDQPQAGCILLRARSFEEARSIADQDPLHKSGLRTYTIQKWRINEGSYTVTVNYSDQSAFLADCRLLASSSL